MHDDFFVGYRDSAPPAVARHLRRAVLALAGVAAATVALVAVWQAPLTPGRFEFGVQRTFEGILEEHPLPVLRVIREDGTVAPHLLVGAGKFGLPAELRGHHGQRLRLRGSLIESGNHRMIECNAPGSLEVLSAPGSAPVPPPKQAEAGNAVLTGELVDTKCHFGVMRPDVGKVHRACAVRCLSGGIPPGLLLRHSDGTSTVVLLATGAQTPGLIDPQWAARQVQAEGRLEFRDGWPVLHVRQVSLADPPRRP